MTWLQTKGSTDKTSCCGNRCIAMCRKAEQHIKRTREFNSSCLRIYLRFRYSPTGHFRPTPLCLESLVWNGLKASRQHRNAPLTLVYSCSTATPKEYSSIIYNPRYVLEEMLILFSARAFSSCTRNRATRIRFKTPDWQWVLASGVLMSWKEVVCRVETERRCAAAVTSGNTKKVT